MITIKDGKMYEDGVEVKPEAGNPEHIKALNIASGIEPIPVEPHDKRQLNLFDLNSDV